MSQVANVLIIPSSSSTNKKAGSQMSQVANVLIIPSSSSTNKKAGSQMSQVANVLIIPTIHSFYCPNYHQISSIVLSDTN